MRKRPKKENPLLCLFAANPQSAMGKNLIGPLLWQLSVILSNEIMRDFSCVSVWWQGAHSVRAAADPGLPGPAPSTHLRH
jgi:hypothetical protein